MAQLIEKEGAKTHMVSSEGAGKEGPVAKVETVKIKVLRPIAVGGIVRNPGETVEVTPEHARELCADVDGPHSFRGERHNEDGDAKRHSLKRAKLITKED